MHPAFSFKVASVWVITVVVTAFSVSSFDLLEAVATAVTTAANRSVVSIS